jgi:hypothetical protein
VARLLELCTGSRYERSVYVCDRKVKKTEEKRSRMTDEMAVRIQV